MKKTTALNLLVIVLFITVVWLGRPTPTQGAQAEDTATAGPTGSLMAPSAVALQDEETPGAPIGPEETETVEPGITPTQAAFSISGVEPREFVQETGGALSIYGSGFIQGMAVRLVGYGLLDAAVVNSNAIRAAIPPGTPEGTFHLEVIMPDSSVHGVGQTLEIHSGRPVATDTPVPGPARAFNQPQLLIDASATQPEILHPGGAFTLKLNLVNRGDYTATNIRVSLDASALAVPVGGSSLSVIDTLQSGETASLEMSLALSDQATAGFQNLELLLNYNDYYRREFSSQQSIGVSISDNLDNQPLVLLMAYHTDPEMLSPGDSFTLKMEVANVGQSDARQVLLTLGGQGSAGLTPFAILSSGNIQFVPLLQPGETVVVEQRLILDGSADAGVYPLPVTLAYDGPDAARSTESQVLNLIASRRPQLQFDFYRPLEPATAGQPVELPIEMINIGRTLVNISTVTISGELLEIAEDSVFIGALDGGTSGTIDVTVIPQASGARPVLLTVNYLDDFNQPQQITATLTFEVAEAEVVSPQEVEANAEEDGGDSFWDRLWRIIRGLFGLGS